MPVYYLLFLITVIPFIDNHHSPNRQPCVPLHMLLSEESITIIHL